MLLPVSPGLRPRGARPSGISGMCPVAERFYEEEISLPLFPGLPGSDQDRVIEAVLGLIR